jgi:hypothetical protein
MVHLRLLRASLEPPSHEVGSDLKVPSLIYIPILNAVIGLPPLPGACQSISTIPELIFVVGASGVLGTEAHSTLIYDVRGLKPAEFLA